MTLANFCESEIENILEHAELIARHRWVDSALDGAAFRPAARNLLQAVYQDLYCASATEGRDGDSPRLGVHLSYREGVARAHGQLRACGGFRIDEMAIEYCALRTSVTQLWASSPRPTPSDLQQLLRFNEAIDQAMCESIRSFTEKADRSRDLFIGMVGHDLLIPLQGILFTAKYLSSLDAGNLVSQASERLLRMGVYMKALLDDLTLFNRKRLGLGIAIVLADLDLRDVFEDHLQQVHAAHPESEIIFDAIGDLRGEWDASRIQQALGNLVVNALRYGTQGRPVKVSLCGTAREITFSVENEGETIPPAVLGTLFEPLIRGPDRKSGDHSLGLGLYICREIIQAHGGSVVPISHEATTRFIACLPRIKELQPASAS